MKKLVLAMITLSLLTAFVRVADAQELKVGAVNAVRILEQSPQAEAMRNQIEKEFAPRDKELVAAQKGLKDMEDRLSKDSAIMSEAERKKLERDILNERRELKRNQDEFREDLTFRRNEEIAKIQKEIVEAIQYVAKQNSFDLVLSDGVLYASPRVDITKLVVDYLQKSTGAAAAAPAAPKPGTK